MPQDAHQHELWQLWIGHDDYEALCCAEMAARYSELAACLWFSPARSAAYASDDLEAGQATLRGFRIIMFLHDPAVQGGMGMLHS